MSARMHADLSDLTGDLRTIARVAKRDMRRVVRKNAHAGSMVARAHARKASGPHGANYYKRITKDDTGPLRSEWGPSAPVSGEPVGAGYRHGPPNNDMAKSLDIQGPKFLKEVRDLPDGWFWPGAK